MASIVVFTLAIVSLICCMRSVISNGSRLGNRRVRCHAGLAAVSPHADAEIAPADESFGFNRGQRIGADQLMEVLGELAASPGTSRSAWPAEGSA